jgi:hypothetical protein
MLEQTPQSKQSEIPLAERIKELMIETLRRYPAQAMMLADAVTAYEEDWLEMAKEKGWSQFADAVIRARRECKFFPVPAEILERIREPQPKGADAVLSEMRELQRQKDAGREFFGRADLAKEFQKLMDAKKVK